jgi:uridylate kinase
VAQLRDLIEQVVLRQVAHYVVVGHRVVVVGGGACVRGERRGGRMDAQ